MNLRGMIVPVIDLRTRLKLQKRDFDASTVVIVVRVRSSRARRPSASCRCGVGGLQRRCRRHSARAGARRHRDGSCVRGIATVDGKMVMLLDIDSLVAACVETDAPRHRTAEATGATWHWRRRQTGIWWRRHE